MKFFQWPTNFENHLPFRFSEMAKPVANAKHSPKSMFITLLQNCTKKLVDY